MRKNLTKSLALGFALAIIAVNMLPAWAAMKVWTSGETLKANDLNSNFTQLYNLASRVIVNADISSSADISQSKINNYRVLPVAWAYVLCAGGSCSINAQMPAGFVSSVTYSAAGSYIVNLAVARSNANYGVAGSSNSVALFCRAGASTASTAVVNCLDAAGAGQESSFTIVFYDDTN